MSPARPQSVNCGDRKSRKHGAAICNESGSSLESIKSVCATIFREPQGSEEGVSGFLCQRIFNPASQRVWEMLSDGCRVWHVAHWPFDVVLHQLKVLARSVCFFFVFFVLLSVGRWAQTVCRLGLGLGLGQHSKRVNLTLCSSWNTES